MTEPRSRSGTPPVQSRTRRTLLQGAIAATVMTGGWPMINFGRYLGATWP